MEVRTVPSPRVGVHELRVALTVDDLDRAVALYSATASGCSWCKNGYNV